jgi:hypothetical protein
MKKFYNKIYVVILEFDVQTILSYLSVFSKDCGV